MAKVMTEGQHTAEFEAGKFDDAYNNDVVTIAYGSAYSAGTVLGQISSSGKFKPFSTSATDGSQNAAAILRDNVDASEGDIEAVAVVRGPYMANGHELIWPDGLSAANKASAIEALVDDAGIKVL